MRDHLHLRHVEGVVRRVRPSLRGEAQSAEVWLVSCQPASVIGPLPTLDCAGSARAPGKRNLAIQPVRRRHPMIAPVSLSATPERNGAPPCSIRGTGSSSTSASLETMYPVPSVWRTSFSAVGHRSSRTSSSFRHPTAASRCRSTVSSSSRRRRWDDTPRLVRLAISCANASAPRSPAADAGEFAPLPR